MRPKQILSTILISLVLFFNSPFIAMADDTAPTDTSTPPAAQQDPAPASDGSASQPSTDPTPPADTTTPPAPPASDPTPAPAADPAPQTPPAADPAPVAAPQYPAKPLYAYDGHKNRWIDTNQTSFYWDPLSGHWQSVFYRYDAFLDRYWVLTPLEISQNLAADAERQQTANTLNQLFGTDPLNSGNGAGSTNNASLTNINNALLQLASLATINNNQNSNAVTGDASANQNVGGGTATTGMATVVSNLLNIINSALSWGSGGISTFVKNIFGNHTGDITINPTATNSSAGGQIGSYNPLAGGISSNQGNGADSTNTATTTNQNDLTIVNKPTGTINNNLDLLAQSGNANANQNVGGASATSGDAVADINILNFINSYIGAGDFFVGMLNIFGNLNGDILFPTGFLDGVVGSSAATGSPSSVSNTGNGTGSTNNASLTNTNNTSITNNPSALFNNNINLGAQSGNANTNDNVGGATATTGSATTTSNMFNFFNNSLFGDNAVLVFVNVMGHWVGGIMNLPSNSNGTEAGLLTGNATVSNTGNGAGSTNDASVNNTNNTNITNSPTGVINNNINAGAISGDANANENVGGANATSGNASVVSNIANFFGSQLNLKKFFGVMFINVFGDWTGKVNEDTAAGNAPVVATAQSSGTTGTGNASVQAHVSNHSSTNGSTVTSSQTKAKLAASDNLSVKTLAAKKAYDAAAAKANSKWPTLIVFLAVGSMLLAAGLSTLERRLDGRA